jgi:hypothetical protein
MIEVSILGIRVFPIPGGPDNFVVRVAQRQEVKSGPAGPRRLAPAGLLWLRHPDNKLSGPPELGMPATTDC